jgi:hypothetical protein
MLPWKPRWRWSWRIGESKEQRRRRAGRVPESRTTDWSSAADSLVYFDEWIFVLIGAVIVMLLIVPAFIFLIEVLIVVVVTVGALLVRVLLRQPWIVDALAGDGTHLTWKVVGYFQSRRVVEEIASQLRAGIKEPRAADAVSGR